MPPAPALTLVTLASHAFGATRHGLPRSNVGGFARSSGSDGGVMLGAVGGLMLGAVGGVMLGAAGGLKLGAGGGLKPGTDGQVKLGTGGGLKLGIGGGLKLGAVGGLKLAAVGGVNPKGFCEALGAALLAGGGCDVVDGAGFAAAVDAVDIGIGSALAPGLVFPGAASRGPPPFAARCTPMAGVSALLAGDEGGAA